MQSYLDLRQNIRRGLLFNKAEHHGATSAFASVRQQSLFKVTVLQMGRFKHLKKNKPNKWLGIGVWVGTISSSNMMTFDCQLIPGWLIILWSVFENLDFLLLSFLHICAKWQTQSKQKHKSHLAGGTWNCRIRLNIEFTAKSLLFHVC